MLKQVELIGQPGGLEPRESKYNRLNWKRNLLCLAAWAGVLLFAAVVAIAQQPASGGAGATPPTVAQQPSDSQIEADVVKALDGSQTLKNEPINAATTEGQVTIFGTVTSESAHELALLLVSKVNGVVKVTDHLKVAGSLQNAQVPAPAAATTQGASVPSPTEGAQPPQVQLPPSDRQQAEQGVATPTVENPQMPGNSAQPTAQQTAQAGRPVYQPGTSHPNGLTPPQYGQAQSAAAPPQYGQPQPPAANYDAAPITIPQGTLVQLRTADALDSKHAQDGTVFEMTVIRDVRVGGKVAIPRGATVHGMVVESRQSGQLGGAPVLALEMQTLDLGGQSYPFASDAFKVRGPSKTGYSATNILGGAGLGTLIGAMVGRGPGAAVGAIVGAGTGTAISASTPGPRAWIPAEALVTFHLEQPVTVTPVSPQEAQRLGQGLFQGGPNLNRRGAGFYAGAPYPAPTPYPYPYMAPMPFYHPYYMMGGYYYWR